MKVRLKLKNKSKLKIKMKLTTSINVRDTNGFVSVVINLFKGLAKMKHYFNRFFNLFKKNYPRCS